MPDGQLIPRETAQLPQGYFRAVVMAEPFKNSPAVEVTYQQGLTIGEVLEYLIPDPAYRQLAVVQLEDMQVYPELHYRVKPKPGASLYIRVVPGVGAAIGLAAAISGAVASAGTAAAIGGGLAATAFTVGGIAISVGTVASFVGAVVSIAVGLALSAIFAPSSPTPISQQREEPVYTLAGARNRLARFEPVPVVLGTHKLVPPYGAPPYTEVVGNDQYLRFVVVWGYGPVDVTDIKIGNTAIADFDEVEVEHDFAGTVGSIGLYPNSVDQETLSITIDETFQTRTTSIDTDEIGITLSFPRGLYRLGNSGQRLNNTRRVVAEYKLTSAGTWTPWFTTTYEDNTAEIKRVTRRVSVTRGQYDIRIKADAEDTDSREFNELQWTALRSFAVEDPIALEGVAKSAFRIKATDQLNGVVDQLNGIVSLKIPAWTGTSWAGENVTSNPAAIFRYILTGAPNKRALGASKVNDTALGDWYDYCVANGLTYNAPISYRANVRTLLQDVAAAGFATPSLVDDVWSVIIDEPRSTVVQHFTPRNSRNFSGRVVFNEVPEGLRIRFLNENKDYQEDERIVYDDGFSAANATKFELLELPGQTDPDNVYKLGRYFLASIRLRPEIFTLEVDVENLVATRGDLVRLNHDVPKIGLKYGRIKSVNTSSNQLELDEPVDMASGSFYSIRVRQSDGTTNLQTVTTVDGSGQDTITVADASNIAAGDLFQFGETGEDSLELLVKAIDPIDDLSAGLTLVPYSSAIYNAASSIPFYTSLLSDPVARSFVGPPTPIITATVTDEAALKKTTQGDLEPTIQVYLKPGIVSGNLSQVTEATQFRARFRRSGTSDPYKYAPRVEVDDQYVELRPVDTGQSYDIEVQAIDAVGNVSDFASQPNVQVLGASADPPQVDTFGVNTIGDFTYAEWTYPSVEVDVVAFEIRYSASQDVTDYGTMVLISDNIPRNSRSFALPSRSGTYAIKAIDVLGNRSTTATFVNASEEDADPRNQVFFIAEDPGFTGTKTGTQLVGSNLELERGLNLFEDTGALDTWSQTGVSISTNVVNDPNGELTAEQVVIDGAAGSHFFSKNETVESGETYTVSIYVQYVDWQYVMLGIGAAAFPSAANAVFDIQNGTIETEQAGVVANSAKISDAGGGWFRISVDAVANASAANAFRFYFVDDAAGNTSFTGDGSSSFYAWGPQLEKHIGHVSYPTTYVESATGNAEGDYIEEGTYEFGETDLGAVYTTRILPSAVIGGSAYGNTMDQWNPLADVTALDGGVSEQAYNVKMEIAFSLDDVATGQTYSAWRPLSAAGDYTARHLKFRTILTSVSGSVTPSVSTLEVEGVQFDSIRKAEGVSSGTGGLAVVFSPAFNVLEAITINPTDLNSGDYWRVTLKSRTGFTIEFFDSGNNSVGRTFDWVAVGHGRERGT